MTVTRPDTPEIVAPTISYSANASTHVYIRNMVSISLDMDSRTDQMAII
jgi:hypothetical protein